MYYNDLDTTFCIGAGVSPVGPAAAGPMFTVQRPLDKCLSYFMVTLVLIIEAFFEMCL